VNSISKIPDQIKKEIYIQECSRIMDISESVLFSTLAQINKKEFQDANTKFKTEQKAFEVLKPELPKHKVNLQYELERKIIEILLLYGGKSADFEDLVLKEDDKTGTLKLEPVVNNARVFEKIYLDLQEDEMQFTNPQFKSLYYTLIDTLHQEPEFAMGDFINKLDQEMASEVTTILMEDERYSLDDWERKQIIPKEKTETIAQLVSQTILSLRCYLIDKKVAEYQQETLMEKPNSKAILEDVKDYLGLKMLLSRKLGKVVGTKI
jgi:DNA primase